MNEDNPHMNNPLQGVGLKTVVDEIVTYYGFDILYAYMNMKCFKTNPSIPACIKFLKKTTWAREKVELFYLYQYKNLPKVSSEQFNVEPRERIVPDHHKPGDPAFLSIEDGERLQQKRDKNAASRNDYDNGKSRSSRAYNEKRSSPWGNSPWDDSPQENSPQDDSPQEKAPRHPPQATPAHSPWAKSADNSSENNQAAKPHFSADSDSKTTQPQYSPADDESTESKPAPDFNPWGNYKKK